MNRASEKSVRPIWIGAAISVLTLVVFFGMQLQYRDVLLLPIQYVILASIPLLVGLLLSGFIRGFKFGDYEISLTDKLLAQSQEIPAFPFASSSEALAPTAVDEWTLGRATEYERTRGYMLAHVYKPSSERGQKFEVSIFVVRHRRGTETPPARNLDEIEFVEFFFGESWGNAIFPVTGEGGFFGAHVHAWGTFLAMCRVTFKDPNLPPVILFRYVDFSMATAQI